MLAQNFLEMGRIAAGREHRDQRLAVFHLLVIGLRRLGRDPPRRQRADGRPDHGADNAGRKLHRQRVVTCHGLDAGQEDERGRRQRPQGRPDDHADRRPRQRLVHRVDRALHIVFLDLAHRVTQERLPLLLGGVALDVRRSGRAARAAEHQRDVRRLHAVVDQRLRGLLGPAVVVKHRHHCSRHVVGLLASVC